jgi:integrase
MTRCGTGAWNLEPGEEERILAALAGAKRPDRERALDADPAFTMQFRLIVATGLRLREAYRLRVDQVDVTRRLIHVEGSKGHRGVIKPRMVPMTSELMELLRPWCQGSAGLLFPFWITGRGCGSPPAMAVQMLRSQADQNHRIRSRSLGRGDRAETRYASSLQREVASGQGGTPWAAQRSRDSGRGLTT